MAATMTLQALGERAPLDAVVAGTAPHFRLDFTRDLRTKELRWVLFTAGKRGAVGKLIFTLEQGGASAHIKSLAVNKEYRGLGLARVLFLACQATLRELGVEQLCLEAEEDAKRHGKLVGMYEHWGFEVVEDAKVLFLYNDTECFRKVPMSLSLRADTFAPIAPKSTAWFCMLSLHASDGTCLTATEDGEIEVRSGSSHDGMWQTMLGQNDGEVYLRSVHGKFLCVEESGNVLADRQINSTWETFAIVPHRSELQQGGRTGGVALRDFHGNYLSVDSVEKKVVSSKEPVSWDGGDLMSLVCNKQGSRPLFAKIMRKYQTESFVRRQAAKYCDFQHATWSVHDACRRVSELTGQDGMEESWVLRYMLVTAESVREEGHPDWLQLAIFLRALGMLFLSWSDDDNAVLRSISAQEWLVQNSTWVVGARIPDSIEYPDLNGLNQDHCDAQRQPQTAAAPVDMDHAVLPWTPDEYLFRALVHNKTGLPSEALAVIRFSSLKTWYIQDNYEDLSSSPQDMDTKEWLGSLGQFSTVSEAAINQVCPDKLLPYYLSLADKYLPPTLQW